MTNGRRILSMLLVCCMMLGLLPNVAFAVNSVSAFSDVRETDWFYDDVNYVCEHQLMNGTSATTFAPQVTTTRAMIVTILHRLEGTPSASNSGFSDVTAGQYYTQAVDWAAEQNIVNGYGNGMFGPDDNITREQMAAILYRYATYKNYDVTKKADYSTFSDANQISGYATDALAWCNAEGLINGMGNNMLAPKGNAIRAQVAAILTRFCKNIVPSEPENLVESKTYTVTFNLNYGKNETYKTEKVADGESVAKPSDPKRTGYTFNGWYTTKYGGTLFDFVSVITEDITLHAQWISKTSGSSSGGGGSFSGVNTPDNSSSDNNGSDDSDDNDDNDDKGNPPVIQLTNSDYNPDTNTILTQKSKVKLEGTVASSNALEKVSIGYSNYYEVVSDVAVTGLSNWSADIDAKIGSNTVTVTALDNRGNKSDLEFVVNRINETIELTDKVKFADESDYESLSDGIIACWNDENGTPGNSSDDNMVMLVENESLLLSQINDNLLKQGEVYMISPNDVFTTGFTGIYDSHNDHKGTDNYPTEIYSSDKYEDIIFNYPAFADIFADDVSIDLSCGVDMEDPIAFALGPNGESVDISTEGTSRQTYMRAQTGTDTQYPKPGWQKDELAKHILPNIEYSIDKSNGMNVTANWDGIVIYDKDGDKETDNDRITLSGDFGLKGMKYTGGIEWHPSIGDLLPQQIMSKLSYSVGGNVKLDCNASVSTEELVEELNDGFENKKELWGFSVSGVDSFKDKWIIGYLGINLATQTPVKGHTIKNLETASKVQPVIFVPFFLTFDGSITFDVTASFGMDNSVVLGFNLQKNGFTGNYGSQDSNLGDLRYNLDSKYTLDIYNSNETSFSLGMNGNVEGSFESGMGTGCGLMLGGLCPALVDASSFTRTKGVLAGNLTLLPEFSFDGSASLYCGVGGKTNISAKMLFKQIKNKENDSKDDEGDEGGDVNLSLDPREFEYMFWEKTIGTRYIDGVVSVSDDDGNNTKVEGASITLTKKDTEEKWNATTDQDGCAATRCCK